jgi:DNA primase
MSRAKRRIARVKDEIDITDLLIGYGYPIHGGGREEQFPCDLHGDGYDAKPSGRFYPESNTIYCFTCDKTRDTIELVREKEGLDFWNAIKYLEQRYKLDPLPFEGDEERWEKDQTAAMVDRTLDSRKTFEDDLGRLTKLVMSVTTDKVYQLPMIDVLVFWEARDKLAWMVGKKHIPEKQGRLASESLRQRLQDLIDQAIEVLRR